MKKISLFITLITLASTVFAQEEAVTNNAQAVASTAPALSTTELLIMVLLVFTLALILVSYTLLRGVRTIYENTVKPKAATGEAEKAKSEKLSLWERLLSLKPLSKEKDLEIPHVYDGIKELNNPIPAWFNWLFYGTIIFGFAYLYYYHIGEWGSRQDDEYKTELAQADAQKRTFLAKSGGGIDENTVKIEESQIEEGKTIYLSNCSACHGEKGEGLVGPNLTDEYWLHGGSINSIFKTIKYGVPEKGMVSWEKSMSAANISAVSNFIISIKGTNPPNAKEPQGEKYVPEE